MERNPDRTGGIGRLREIPVVVSRDDRLRQGAEEIEEDALRVRASMRARSRGRMGE
jgi:hypothetical protein